MEGRSRQASVSEKRALISFSEKRPKALFLYGENAVTDCFPITLTERREWRKGLVTLRFERPADFTFRCGQFARLNLPMPDGSMLGRAYSMVSQPEDPFLEFYVGEVAGGAFSPLLVNLAPGSTVYLEKEVFGNLLPSRIRGGKNLWLLSTGTGLAPFMSFIHEEIVWKEWSDVVLVHSVRRAEDLSYREEIERAAADAALGGAAGRKLHYVPIVTREATPYFSRHVQDLLQEGAVQEKTGISLSLEDSRILLCGNPTMVTDVRAYLQSLGFKAPRRGNPGNLLAETLW
jgi:ferredoxin--NADP+ reductase